MTLVTTRSLCVILFLIPFSPLTKSLYPLQLGTTAIGIQTSEGVVLAVEKRVASTLMESSSIEKILEIDTHLGCAMSGMTADSRTMIDHARVAAQVCLDFDNR